MPLMYAPLQEFKDEIRLLTLHPSSQDGPITCSMENRSLGRYTWPNKKALMYDWEHSKYVSPEHLDLEEVDFPWVPDYAALSYTWNPSHPVHVIKINDQDVGVGHNLYCALRQLSQTEKDKTLWIDALCINQNDLKERSKQVRRMRRIYQRAAGVVIWLGEADLTSDLAFDTLERMCGTDEQRDSAPENPWARHGPEYDADQNHSDDPEQNALFQMEMYGKSWTYVDQLGLSKWSDIEQNAREALKELLNRDYWARVWCVQEVAMARELLMLCGTRKIELNLFDRQFQSPSRAKDSNGFSAFIRGSGLATMLAARDNMRDSTRGFGYHPNTPLNRVIERYRDFEATDARDKIYALLGLPSADDTMPLEVDYSKSIAEIFTSTARAMIDWSRDLYLLTLPKPEEKSDLELPSWVPDWTLPRPQIEGIEGFCASKDYPVTGQDFPDLATQGETELLLRRLTRGVSQQISGEAQDTPKLPLRRRSDRGLGGFTHILKDPSWQREFGGYKSSLVSRSQHVSPPHISTSPSSLHIEVIPLSSICWSGASIETASLESDLWKDTVRAWSEHLIVTKEVPITTVHTALLRGAYMVPDNTRKDVIKPSSPESWYTTWDEAFLTLAGQVSPEHLTHPDLHEILSDENFYEEHLKLRLRGWIPALIDLGPGGQSLWMVPNQSRVGDWIVIAFGADAPLVLRPVDEGRWKLVGAAFCYELMSGLFVELNEKQGLDHSLWPQVEPCEIV